VRTKEGLHRTLGSELATQLISLSAEAKYIGDDDKLVKYVTGKDVGKHIICFMGAYGWRGMIEDVMKAYRLVS
jgi:hypothetical protein